MSYLEEWHKQQKALKEQERRNKMGAANALNSFKAKTGNAFESKQRELKEADRKNKQKTQQILNSYHAGDLTEHLVSPVQSKGKKNFNMSMPGGLSFIPEPENTKAQQNDVVVASKKRQVVELTFLFGLIYDEEALEPDFDDCSNAASAIVPDVIARSVKELPPQLRCDVKSEPIVTGAPDIDDWFDKEGSVRYVIRGKVPVTLFLLSDGDKPNDPDESVDTMVAPLQKLLKRHTSFRPIAPADAKKEKNQDLIVECKGRLWIRVRESRLGGLGITF